MILIKRVISDVRGPNLPGNQAQMDVNEALTNLQTGKNGRNKDITVIDVKEINKDSGILVFLIIYDDKGMDLTKPSD